MNQADEKYVDVDGIRTRYFEKGSGETVVLFHGGNFGSNEAADGSPDWGLNFDGLAQWFHVVAVDQARPRDDRQPQERRGLHHGRGGCGTLWPRWRH